MRPEYLLAEASYKRLPKAPLLIDWSSVPETVCNVVSHLSGVQPITDAMAKVSGGTLFDKPTQAEVELFRNRGASFQLISIVVSVFPAKERDNEVVRVRPFSITLIPASKWGKVSHTSIDSVAALDVDKWLASQPAYSGYDPFSGDWSMYGTLPGYLDGEREGFLDEFGIVTGQFFLSMDTRDDNVLMPLVTLPSDKMRKKYESHRRRLLFSAFNKVEARRIWGAETPIELFLIQALARDGIYPDLQMLVMENGATFPALYDLWGDVEFRHSPQMITEADLYFPDKKVAVFCDGTHHSRPKQKVKDEAINLKLAAAGIQAVRIPSAEIKFDLSRAVARVRDAIS